MKTLEICDLAVSYGNVAVLHGVSLTVARGECLGLVGESGCGKSTVALAALRALPRGGRITAGRIIVDGQDITALRSASLRAVWARKVSMVYQDASRALNPTMTIGAQIMEAFTLRRVPNARARAEDALAGVRITNPARIMTAYAHQLSGGMQQRAVIAMALAKEPALLVLDEPTTGLDATVEADILELINELRRSSGTAVLLISHNLPMVGRMADRIGVLYAGVLVEQGPVADVLRQPRHPYTDRLLRCLPTNGVRKTDGRLATIPGQLPALGSLPEGCVFAPRCHAAELRCHTVRPPVHGPDEHRARCHFDPPFAAPAEVDDDLMPPRDDRSITLSAASLSKTYAAVKVVCDVSFEVAEGETLGLVGESGSGKTTLARMLLGLVTPDVGGTIMLNGNSLAPRLQARSHVDRKAMQIVFQNPDSALNRAQTVRTILARPLTNLAGLSGVALARKLTALADGVRLGAAQLRQRPHALSGGLKQRVAIARAFAGDPRVVICDEPTSALDVSVQAAILNLLVDLQRREKVSYIFISHDLNVVRYLCDRVAVLYRGQVVQLGPAEAVFRGPHHPYTRALLSAAAGAGETRLAETSFSSAAGCVFQVRCPRKLGAICETVDPPWSTAPNAIRCHIPPAEL